jgi:alpha-methylacyl-CoA racemase
MRLTADCGTGGGPLQGMRVIELAGIGPSQHGAMLLADLGADVVRVDRPQVLEVEDTSGEILSRGRRSIVLNLKDASDLEIARRLIDGADVAVDPYRPGVLERIGLGPEETLVRNPRLVFARMTGWGQAGPLAQAPGHDINYIALAGALQLMGADGEPPQVPLNLIADFGGGGMLLAFGIVVALLERERSGHGQVIDVAMVDGVASLLSGVLHLRGLGHWTPGRGTNWLQGAAPWYRAYRTADDAYLTVGSLEHKFYVYLLERLDLEPSNWPQWDVARWPALATEMENRFAERPLKAWQKELEGSDACFAPALSLEDMIEHEHIRARETYLRRHGVVQPAPVPRFGRTPGALGRRPPHVGEHNAEIRAEVGC